MKNFFARIISFFTSVITLFSVSLFPQTTEPIFDTQTETEKEKTVFDEGEMHLGAYDLVVSPYGNDNNEGTLSSPLKTPAAAKEKVKQYKGLTDETVTVWFREGNYTIDSTLQFTAEDKTNVIYRSCPDEKVAFTGAKEITQWNETTLNGIRVFTADVEIESETDYFRSLYKDNTRLSRSTYPKEGFLQVKDPALQEFAASSDQADFFSHSLGFYANKGELSDFSNAEDIDVRIMHFWCDDLLPVHSIDAESGRIEMRKPTAMTIRVEDNFVLENVKEALRVPGEWYLDRNEEKLYYVPQDGDTVENTVLSAGKTKQLISMNGVKDIAFRGIRFEKTDWNHTGKETHFGNPFDETHPLYGNIEFCPTHPQAAFEEPAAILISACTGIDFTDCRFENISYSAVKFESASSDCSITSSLFHEIGGNAVFIHGDLAIPATTHNINITDCHIGFYGRIFNNAIGILLTHASDCILSNNEIHDGWYTGISVGWVWGYGDNPTNNIEISDNLIYNIGNGWLSDMGAIYTLGKQPDSVIRGNVIYNVGCDEGRYGYGGWGIYLDEGTSGMLVENNLVYDCSSQTFHQHYGKDNIVRNNIFAFGGDGAMRITRHEEHNSLFLTNNILVTDNATMYKQTTEKDWFIDDANVYYDYTKGGNVYSGDSMSLIDRKSLVAMTVRGYYNNACFADPLFKDAENRDFTLATNSPALQTGFIPWDYTQAGTNTLFE